MLNSHPNYNYRWHPVASWTWDAQDETCGICRMAFDGCCPDCKFPGDDCPLSESTCHFFFFCMPFILYFHVLHEIRTLSLNVTNLSCRLLRLWYFSFSHFVFRVKFKILRAWNLMLTKNKIIYAYHYNHETQSRWN